MQTERQERTPVLQERGIPLFRLSLLLTGVVWILLLGSGCMRCRCDQLVRGGTRTALVQVGEKQVWLDAGRNCRWSQGPFLYNETGSIAFLVHWSCSGDGVWICDSLTRVLSDGTASRVVDLRKKDEFSGHLSCLREWSVIGVGEVSRDGERLRLLLQFWKGVIISGERAYGAIPAILDVPTRCLYDSLRWDEVRGTLIDVPIEGPLFVPPPAAQREGSGGMGSLDYESDRAAP